MTILAVIVYVFYDLAPGVVVGNFDTFEDCMIQQRHVYAQREKMGAPLPGLCYKTGVQTPVHPIRPR